MECTEGQTSLSREGCYRLPAAGTSPSWLSSLTLIQMDGGNERPQCHSGNERPQWHSGNERPGAQTRGPRCCGIEEQKRGINIPAHRPNRAPAG